MLMKSAILSSLLLKEIGLALLGGREPSGMQMKDCGTQVSLLDSKKGPHTITRRHTLMDRFAVTHLPRHMYTHHHNKELSFPHILFSLQRPFLYFLSFIKTR